MNEDELNFLRRVYVPYQEIPLVGSHSEEYERGFWDAVDYLKKVQTGEIKHKSLREASLISHKESKCNINVTEQSDLETYMLRKGKILPSGNVKEDISYDQKSELKSTITYVTEENVSPDEPIAVIYQDPDTNRPALRFTNPFKYKAMSVVNADIPLYVRADKEKIYVKCNKNGKI